MKAILLVCIMTLSITACSLGGLAPTATAPAVTAAPATTLAPSALTAEQVRNMKVRLVAKDAHPTVQMQDGEYKNGSDPASPDYAAVRLDPSHMALGDLNGDGLGDAAVLMAENYGGTGVFVSLVAVLNNGGQAVEAGAMMIDDRPVVSGLAIQDRQIMLEAKVHGPNDPGCCAAQPVAQTYGLIKGGLELFRSTSKGPDGRERAVHIESPASGSQVLGAPLQVKGNYSVAPFEGILSYHVYDELHNTVAAGPLLTNPASGGGVTFDETVDLTALPSGSVVRLDVADISAADGSTIAMDSVELMIK